MYIVTSQNYHDLPVLWQIFLKNSPSANGLVYNLTSKCTVHGTGKNTKTKIRNFEGELNEQGYNSDALAYY
jgi:hypothetical protein